MRLTLTERETVTLAVKGYRGAFRDDLPEIIRLYRAGKSPKEISAVVKPHPAGYRLTAELVRYILNRELGVEFTQRRDARARATPERTRRMAELINGGAKVKEVAASFGVSPSRVAQLVCGTVFRMKRAKGEEPVGWSAKDCARILMEARP